MNVSELTKRFELTEDEMEARAEEYENDAWDMSEHGPVHDGKPTKLASPIETVTINEPEFTFVRIGHKARQKGCTSLTILETLSKKT